MRRANPQQPTERCYGSNHHDQLRPVTFGGRPKFGKFQQERLEHWKPLGTIGRIMTCVNSIDAIITDSAYSVHAYTTRPRSLRRPLPPPLSTTPKVETIAEIIVASVPTCASVWSPPRRSRTPPGLPCGGTPAPATIRPTSHASRFTAGPRPSTTITGTGRWWRVFCANIKATSGGRHSSFCAVASAFLFEKPCYVCNIFNFSSNGEMLCSSCKSVFLIACFLQYRLIACSHSY
ncbi:hypothetical protein BJ742DRAFT_181908 [Cladochytrium replicatum]|nr:hypothetical protein BJ742DRAFT_181908 [Cladochytrium replicatum]